MPILARPVVVCHRICSPLLNLRLLSHPISSLKSHQPVRHTYVPEFTDRTKAYWNTQTLQEKKRNNAVSNAAPCSDEIDQITEKKDEGYMAMALQQAEEAFALGEVPVGAVLVAPSGQVISAAHNTTETDHDPTCHAEMTCIRQACAVSQGWRLLDCTLYVTLEPCPMCAGAILQSRVGTVVYGAPNPLLGADGSWIRMFPSNGCVDSKTLHPFHPDIVVRRGVCADECASIIKKFFKMRRQES
ncbi:hypothetical protein M9435_006538 [Picochlorum sp. BPE23]|nr:hypothetical protein M9435_006538 [Picochlorum sp. BPE23]